MPDLINTIKHEIESKPNSTEFVSDLFKLVKSLGRSSDEARKANDYLLNLCALRLRSNEHDKDVLNFYYEQYGDCLLFASHYSVDSYLQRLEWRRDIDKRFYLPRRKQLKEVVDGLQGIFDGDIELLTISLPPGVGKSTLGTFFLTMVMGVYPDKYHVASGYVDSLTKMFYDNILNIITDGNEYCWQEIFPDLNVSRKNGAETFIDIATRHAYPTFTAKPIGGALTGKVRCSGILYSDDLVSGIEEAMNPQRLDNLWYKYTNDLKSRTINGYREILVATRWSVNDPIGRIQRENEDNPKAKFITVPALDENGESNFDYDYNVGFSTPHYLEMKQLMDEASWTSLYMNEPYEREGQLYPEDELRRYSDLPIDPQTGLVKEPDAKIAICDTKDKGKDYCFLPVVYVYGHDYYIVDCVVNNGVSDLVEAQLVNTLLVHNVQMARFESNSAGGRIADKIQREINEREGVTHITKKTTSQNKETKILTNSAWVKKHCIFKDKNKYKQNSDYGRMMRFINSYTITGKNKYDDVPDGLAMLAIFAQELNRKTFTVVKNPLKMI